MLTRSPFLLDPVAPKSQEQQQQQQLPRAPLYVGKRIKVMAVRSLLSKAESPRPSLKRANSNPKPATFIDSATATVTDAPVNAEPASVPLPEVEVPRPVKRIRLTLTAALPKGVDWDMLNADTAQCADCKGAIITAEREGRTVCSQCGLVAETRLISDNPERYIGNSDGNGKDNGNPRVAFNSRGLETESIITYIAESGTQGGGELSDIKQTHARISAQFRHKSDTLRSRAELALHKLHTIGGHEVPKQVQNKALVLFDGYLKLDPNFCRPSMQATLVVLVYLAYKECQVAVTARTLWEVNEGVKWSAVREKLKLLNSIDAQTRAQASAASLAAIAASASVDTTAAAEVQAAESAMASAAAAARLKIRSVTDNLLADYVDAFLAQFQAHAKVSTFCKFVARRITQLSMLIGKKPESQLSAVLLFATVVLPEAKGLATLKRISQLTGTGEATIYKHFLELYAKRRHLVPIPFLDTATAAAAATAATSAADHQTQLHNALCAEYDGPRLDPTVFKSLPDKVQKKTL